MTHEHKSDRDQDVVHLGKERGYEGKFFNIDRERLRLPNGQETELEILRHPGASCVVPLRPDGTVVMIRQYRFAASGYIFEVPAGKLDPGETPETCARREVVEEVGLEAGRLHSLGFIHTTPGFTDEIIHLYVATELRPAEQALEFDEVIEVLEMPLSESLDLIARGEITDSKTLCALMRTQQEIDAGRLRLS